jgi:hypothetical protein
MASTVTSSVGTPLCPYDIAYRRSRLPESSLRYSTLSLFGPSNLDSRALWSGKVDGFVPRVHDVNFRIDRIEVLAGRGDGSFVVHVVTPAGVVIEV